MQNENVFQKGLGDMFPKPSVSAPTLYSKGGDIDHGKSAQGCVCVTYTVVYGRGLRFDPLTDRHLHYT